MSLPELLQWVQMGRKTGTLVFEHRGVVKKVYAEEGMIISASSNDPREYLGQILVFFGHLTEEKLNQAFQLQKQKRKLLGKVLVEEFGLAPDEILKSLRLKIEETVYNIFLWEDGKFIYTEGLLGLSDHDRLKAALSIEQIIFEGARRTDEWNEFRKTFPTDDFVFKHSSAALNKESEAVLKDSIVKKIFDSIDGKKSIQRVLLETHAPEYRGYEAFGKLYWSKAIEANKDAPAPKKKTVQSIRREQLVEAAKLFKSKNFSAAYELMVGYVTEKPQDEEGQTLFRALQEAYVKQLYQALPPQDVPVLTMDFSDLNEKIYSSEEGFLASRINGEWDVKSLIMVSPMGELESLKILKRLYDNGMVRFKG